MDPISDLQSVWSYSAVQPAATSDLLRQEDAQIHVSAQLPIVLPLADHLHAPFESHRLLSNPRHPRAEMFEALGNRSVKHLGVGRTPATQHQVPGSVDHRGEHSPV